MDSDNATGLLGGLKVLELGSYVSAPYCALTLAKLGADVIKIEPPTGDESRKEITLGLNANDKGISSLFLSLNHNKKSVVLDLDILEDQKRFLKLAESTDIIVENTPIEYLRKRNLGFDKLKENNASLIMISILPFGEGNAYSDYVASDLSLFHMSGNAHGIIGPVKDPDTEPPLRAGGYQADMVAGLTATTASMIALHKKMKTGIGCHVIVSAFEAMVTMAISGLANTAFGKPHPTRKLQEQEGSSIGGMVSAIGGVLPCIDGFVAISPREDAQWERWVEMMGHPDWAEDERFNTRSARENNVEDLWVFLSEWSLTKSKYDISRDGQNRRIPCFPVNTIEDLLRDSHLEYREFFMNIEHPELGLLKYPSLPYKLNNVTVPVPSRPAPNLGFHNKVFFNETGS